MEFCKDLPLHRYTLQTSNNKDIDKLPKPTINNSLLQCENCFKQVHINAYKHSVENNIRAHRNRKKHKLGIPLEIGPKVLMENHQIEISKSKNTRTKIWILHSNE